MGGNCFCSVVLQLDHSGNQPVLWLTSLAAVQQPGPRQQPRPPDAGVRLSSDVKVFDLGHGV